MRYWLSLLFALLLSALPRAHAESAAEVLDPGDEALPAQPANAADSKTASKAPAATAATAAPNSTASETHAGQTPPPPAPTVPVVKATPSAAPLPGPGNATANDPVSTPGSVPLEINEPGFTAKIVYHTQAAPGIDPSPEQQPDPVLREWGLAEEEGVKLESDIDASSESEDDEPLSPLLARAVAREKKGKKASEMAPIYQRVVDAEPANAEAHYRLGVALTRSGEAKKGALSIEKAIALKPKSPRYLCTYGQAALKLGWLEKGLAATEAAAMAVPSDARYQSAYGDALLVASRYPEATAAYTRAIAIDKGRTPAYMYNLGLVHLHCNEFKEAIRVFDRAIAAKKDYAPFFCSRGLAYQHLRNIKQAGADYAQALKIDKNYAYAHYLLAGIYSNPDDPTYTNKFEAVSHAETACKLTEYKDARYLMGLARALRVAFNYDQALVIARKAIQIDPREEYQRELSKYEAQLKQEGAFLDHDKK